MTMKKLGITVACVIVIGAVGLLLIALQYEIPKPTAWSANVKVYRKAITGETRVFDGESGRFLFAYRPEYDPNVRPIKVDRIDQNHWQIVLENPSAK
jgi:hypothetical protein